MIKIISETHVPFIAKRLPRKEKKRFIAKYGRERYLPNVLQVDILCRKTVATEYITLDLSLINKEKDEQN